MLKKTLVLCLLCGLLPVRANAQNPDGRRWQLFALGGAFSPSNDALQSIYASSFTGKVALSTRLGERGRLQLGLQMSQRKGDPFYNSAGFDAGNAATLRQTGLSLLAETDLLTPNYPKLYLGAGIEYLFARETITEQPAGRGNNVGAILSVSPELRIAGHLLLLSQINYRFVEMTFRSDRTRYRFNLSGVSILVGVGYNF